jgi:hypothetical protein
MSRPSTIAAIRHAISALHGAADEGADTRRYADALQEAGAAIDDLIEAAKAARAGLQHMRGPESIIYARTQELDAALARVQGGAA